MNSPSNDQEHLRWLEIAHYVVGGITMFFACLPLIHLSLGLAMVFSPEWFGNNPANHPPPFFGWLFVILGGVFFLLGQALAVCLIVSGRFLKRRSRYLFVFIVACVACMLMPFGTILGVFTIIVPSRDSVKLLFEAKTPPPLST